jgi:PPOX class probable F420-dependent enzyme
MSFELSAESAELLRSARVARLGTADAGGQPLVIPICFAFDGRFCYSAIDAKPKRHSAERLTRVRNIQENPRVSLLVDHYEEEWTRLRYVIVRGRAELLNGGPEFARAADLLLEKYPQYRAMKLDRTTGLMIKITPDRITQWNATPPAS